MSLAAALLLTAQAASPNTAAPVAESAAPVAERASASATILRPAQIKVEAEGRVISLDTAASALAVQRRRDDAGTQWIEFS